MDGMREPTRITATGATLLDLIITNYPGLLVRTGTLRHPVPINSDHCFIFGKINISLCNRKSFKRDVWNFGNTNAHLFNNNLASHDWSSCFNSRDVNVL